MLRKISVVIPTLWLADELRLLCDELNFLDIIGEVVIINNDNNRKNIDFSKYGSLVLKESLLCYEKIHTVEQYGKFKVLTPPGNIYVSEAWNVGVTQCNYEVLCLLNDDTIPPPDLYRYISAIINEDIGLIGISAASYNNSISPDVLPSLVQVEQRPLAFGCCMFLLTSKYKEIPISIKVFFNDDYLFARVVGKHYTIINTSVRGTISKTNNNPTVQQFTFPIIHQDSIEFHRIMQLGL